MDEAHLKGEVPNQINEEYERQTSYANIPLTVNRDIPFKIYDLAVHTSGMNEDIDIPQIEYDSRQQDPEWFFDYSGISAKVKRSAFAFHLTKSDGNIVDLPLGAWRATADFMPLGKNTYIPGTTSDMIAKGIKAMEIFLDSLGREIPGLPKAIPLPAQIIGTTNPQMAKFIERLGFSSLAPGDTQLYLQMGIKVPRNGEVAVIADPLVVKERFSELQNRTSGGRNTFLRIIERVDKNQSN